MPAYLFQLALAAFRAISARRSGVIFAALALPPLRPPRRPRLTAAVSFPSNGGSGSRSSTSPLAISIISLASWAGSWGRFTPVWPLGIVIQATKNDVSFLQLIDSGLHPPYCALE